MWHRWLLFCFDLLAIGSGVFDLMSWAAVVLSFGMGGVVYDLLAWVAAVRFWAAWAAVLFWGGFWHG